MARGIFTSRSRLNTPGGSISNPTLTHTDAEPRNDLLSLREVSANIPPPHRSGAVSGINSERTESRSRQSQGQDWPTAKPTFDSQVTAPPAKAISSYTAVDNAPDCNMIGIALGSPGMVNPLNQTTADVPEVHGAEDVARAQLRRKPSKWKKFGDLFRSKTAAAPPSNPPFCQVQTGVNDPPPQASGDSVARPEVQSQSQHDFRRQKTLRKSVYRKEDNKIRGAWQQQEGGHINGHHKHDEDSERQGLAQNEQAPKFSFDVSGPLLQVEIPNIQLERYSVMFGSVLGKNKPSTLLARRSKTLDNLVAPPPECGTTPEDNHKAKRRATSPSATNPPAFSLFPKGPSSDKQSRSQSLPRGSSPLRRSETPPAGRQSHDGKEHIVEHSPPLTTSATSQTRSEPEEFCLSPETVNTSLDEDARLVRLKSVQSDINPQEEPAREMVTRKTETPDTQRRSTESTPNTMPEEMPPMMPPKDGPSSPETASPRPSQQFDRIISTQGTQPTPSGPKSNAKSRDDRRSEASTFFTVEVGVARSVSVSRGTRVVAVGGRPRHGTDPPRLGEKRPQTPTVGDKGHRHREL
ncbi:hypothetical protein VTN02DRAFT_2332 [Thermoascus thermophilus]